jgi:hypothetical protein
MTSTIVFDLVSALVDTCASVVPSGVAVYDGQPSTDDPGSFLMVGVADPNSADSATSASGTLEWAGLGHNTSKEHGTITCCAMAWTGNVGNAAQKDVRQAVRDISSAVEVVLRTDPNLGGVVPGLNWVRYAGDWNLEQLSAFDGVAAVFHFEIAYQASLSAN